MMMSINTSTQIHPTENEEMNTQENVDNAPPGMDRQPLANRDENEQVNQTAQGQPQQAIQQDENPGNEENQTAQGQPPQAIQQDENPENQGQAITAEEQQTGDNRQPSDETEGPNGPDVDPEPEQTGRNPDATEMTTDLDSPENVNETIKEADVPEGTSPIKMQPMEWVHLMRTDRRKWKRIQAQNLIVGRRLRARMNAEQNEILDNITHQYGNGEDSDEEDHDQTFLEQQEVGPEDYQENPGSVDETGSQGGIEVNPHHTPRTTAYIDMTREQQNTFRANMAALHGYIPVPQSPEKGASPGTEIETQKLPPI